MRHTLSLFTCAVLTAAGLVLASDASSALAGGPRSRTAWDDRRADPFVDLNSACPLDDDEYVEQDRPAAEDKDADELKLGLNLDEGADIAPADIPLPADETTTSSDDAVEPTASHAEQPSAAGLSPRMATLRAKVRSTLAYYNKKRLNTRDHNPWEVMHSIVAYGVNSHLSRSGPEGQPVNAISWLCWNGDCKGTRILEVNGGRVAARKGPQVQGHPGQFLAILAQSSVTTDCPIKVGGKHFTLADLIESEKLGCEAGTELTFKLISFSYYLNIDARWKNAAGQDWSVARVVQEELKQPIVGAACGGTHRLMGFAYAVRKREASGRPMTGEFLRAKKYLDDYHRYTLTKLQNEDGSFSTEWFKAPGARPDLGRRIQTSGHILEWLSYSLSNDMLQDPQIVKAVEYLAGVLHDGQEKDWDVGPLGHALHSLAIYDSRVFKPLDEPRDDARPADDVAAGTPSLDRDAAVAEKSVAPAKVAAPQASARLGRRDPRSQAQRPTVRRATGARP